MLRATPFFDSGKYFSQYLQDQIEKKALGGAAEVRNILEEVRAQCALPSWSAANGR